MIVFSHFDEKLNPYKSNKMGKIILNPYEQDKTENNLAPIFWWIKI